MWKYYKIIKLNHETQRKVEELSGITYRSIRSEAIDRIIKGTMANRPSNILYFAKGRFNKALREKNVNVRVI